MLLYILQRLKDARKEDKSLVDSLKMLMGGSYTAVGVASSFSLVVVVLIVTREYKDAKMTRRETVGVSKVGSATMYPKLTSLHANADGISQDRDETEPRTPSSYTCLTNTSAAFDTSGNPCVDMDRAARRQSIYAINAKDVSYVYCSIPKNGCTYHLGIMHRLLGFDYQGGYSVHESSNKNRLEVSPKLLQTMLLDPKIEKYMVVRNPLERVLSAYFDKVERYLPPKNQTPAAFKEWAYGQLEPGMDQKSTVNPHWRPQMTFCGLYMRDLWKRFRWFTVEEPAEYVDFLEEILPEWVTKDGWNGSDNTSLREAVLGPRKRTGNTSERFFKYVPTLELFDYLVEVYRIDIVGLGYQGKVAEMRKELTERVDKKSEGGTYSSEEGTK